VSAGGDHACAVKKVGRNHTVVCWGSNTHVSCDSGYCVERWYGQSTPPDWDDIKTTVSAGEHHSCMLLLHTSGRAICFGYNSELPARYAPVVNQLGPFTKITSGGVHNCAIRQIDETAECWGADSYGQSTPPAGVAFAQLTAGQNHTCGLLKDGSVRCWGGNTWGQAPASREGPYTEIAAGDLFTCGLKPDGEIDCWGFDFYGQRRPPAGPWTAFGLGDAHGCATNDETGVWQCWGRNNHGQATPPMPGASPKRFDFAGFYPPLAADTGELPALNVVKAGSAVPLKFSLGGDQGLNVIEAGHPASGALNCKTMDPSDDRESAKAAGKSALAYDPASGQYTYVWKTEKAWKGTCRYLSLRLADGTEHRAAFRFK